jgi:hypothetical protein
MRKFLTAIARFFLGPASGLVLIALVCLAYYLAEN